MEAALAFALQLLEGLPALITAGADVVGLIETQTAEVKAMVAANAPPTQAQWDALNAQVNAVMAQLKP